MSSRYNGSNADHAGSSGGIGGLAGQTTAMDLNNSHNHSHNQDRLEGMPPPQSRRPSANSTHSSSAQSQTPHSPASISSSGTHPWMTPRDTPELNQLSSSPQTGMSQLPQPALYDQQQQHQQQQHQIAYRTMNRHHEGVRPPLETSNSDEGVARSAPNAPSPISVTGSHPFAPARSSSDPSRSGEGSKPNSPMASPVGHTPNFASSHVPTHWTAENQTRNAVFPTALPAAAAQDGIPTPRRSETPSTVTSSHGTTSYLQPQQPTPKRSGSVTHCAKCGQVVRGQFVRALHKVYHLDCFRCRDCDKVVAQKFFPVEDNEGGQYPLCERDYFARLDLICAKCDQALRSSYITACGDKFHVEHFSCSVCDTVFGANDSYYEHDGKVYCHYHYSISFANKCVGCETAILKQFVEINRNGKDECWHPECYMIHKFWNVRLASRNFTTPANQTPVSSSLSLLEISSMGQGGLQPMASSASPSTSTSPGWGNDMTAAELKERQITMELKVSQIWLVLSGFEESSAACIGEMLRVVNERKLLDVILLAERFILHVETLFAVIDDLEAQFAMAGAKGMAHAREAKQLCRKLVNFFSMLSQISPHGGSIPNMQELLTQVTQLAHYLKILIRIALTGAIKLDRDHGNPTAMTNALAKLHLLSLDNADPSLRKRGDHPPPSASLEPWTGNETPEETAKRSFDSLTRTPDGFIPSTQKVAYGYRSLAVEVTGETTLRGPQDDNFVPNDGCARCNGSIEDDCVRAGMFNRWHAVCIECHNQECGAKASDGAEVPSPKQQRAEDESQDGMSQQQHETSSATKHPYRRAPAKANEFAFEPPQQLYGPAEIMWCGVHRTVTSVNGFQPVTRLEQFAFLLHVALRRLYLHFREHHKIPSALTRTEAHDVKRVKSVTLDRKLSSTARLPQRSTVIDSPAGKMADENGQIIAAAKEHVTPVIMTPSDSSNGESATVDVIRPPFARNNTSVRILSEQPSDSDVTEGPERAETDTLTPLRALPGGRRVKEDDAITLSDIPMLASRRNKSPLDNLPLIAQISPLQNLIIRHFALLHLQKTGLGHLVEPEELMDLLDSRKNQWWNKLFKGNAKKDQKRKGIFGVPIEILVARTGSDSQQGISPDVLLRVPEFIEEITSTMRQQDMSVEGIFRKNGNIRRLQQISEALDKDYSSVVLSEENPVQLAALMKKFLREIPDPLLTFRLHRLFCAAASMPNVEDRRRCLHLLMMLLPRPNRDTIEVIFVFLRWVASFSYRDEETGSRMDLANLATVITPSILYAKGASAARDESFIGIQAVQQLLEEQDDFYRVPPELMYVLRDNVASLFTKDIDLPPKEIHKHCTKYLQARGGPQWHGSGPATGHRPSYSIASGAPMTHGGRATEGRMQGHHGGVATPGEDNALRPAPSPLPHNGTSRPTSWSTASATAAASSGSNTPSGKKPNLTMPMPPNHFANGTPMVSPSGYSQHAMPLPSPGGWQGRGPFQGSAASNGSRHSSRGSAPPSPGITGEERRSFQMERDRSRDRAWTPTQPQDR